MPEASPIVSFVIPTFNRRDVLLGTLAAVANCGLRSDEFETIVIDNASGDGTADAVDQHHPAVHLIRLDSNRGPVAKNLGIEAARGRYVVFLDDDSYPDKLSIRWMIAHFEASPRLGAAVFTVTLPDGSEECSAYPNICIGCGTGFRRRALRQVGGLPEDFFMAAEEYDLSLRLLAGGWEVERFDDLCVTHLKSPVARFSRQITRLDVRNNLLLVARYFPTRWVEPFLRDWLHRYWLIASAKGHRSAWWRGAAEGLVRAWQTRRDRVLDEATFEKFARIEETERRLRGAQEHLGFERILFVDMGKNMLAYWRAAQKCGLEVVGIADPHLGGPGRMYHGVPIVSDEAAADLDFDVAIVSNLSPVHARQRSAHWRTLDPRPVLDLFDQSLFLPDLWQPAGEAAAVQVA